MLQTHQHMGFAPSTSPVSIFAPSSWNRHLSQPTPICATTKRVVPAAGRDGLDSIASIQVQDFFAQKWVVTLGVSPSPNHWHLSQWQPMSGLGGLEDHTESVQTCCRHLSSFCCSTQCNTQWNEKECMVQNALRGQIAHHGLCFVVHSFGKLSCTQLKFVLVEHPNKFLIGWDIFGSNERDLILHNHLT